jgi:carbon-monoxide dehydrogenase large subunit
MGKFGTGQAIRRKEDQRFLTGTGTYTDDVTLDGQAYLYVFRSPFAHGSITSLDVDEARNADGVLAVYTAKELADAGINDLYGAGIPPGPAGGPREPLRQRALARDKVRYVGEPVAAVVAESYAQARDAAELIWLDVDELDAVVTPLRALSDGAPTIHDEAPGNLYGILDYGNAEATEQAFADADHVVEVEIINNRLAPTALEPRACNMSFADGVLTVLQGSQGVHNLRDRLAEATNLAPEAIHVISPDVGGGFGLKYFLQCESVVAAHASIALGRPVKWTADRTESFLADTHGRDHQSNASFALRGDGRILAMRATVTATFGAYCSQVGPIIPWFGASMSTGCYDIPTAYIDVRLVLTNTTPVDAYRGAGRPEASYLVERLMDKAAMSIGIAPDELRRRNFIKAEQFPYSTVTGQSYDSGDYSRVMDAGLGRADWQGFTERKARSVASGKLRGIGMSYYVEICSGLGSETVHVRVEENGRITALLGTQATGQGHETTYSQIMADMLGVNSEIIDIVQGDTRKVPTGFGTVGSRSMAIGGSSLIRSTEALIESGRQMAAEQLEAALADIEFGHGEFRIAGTDRSLTLAEVARASYDDQLRPEGVSAGLAEAVEFTPEAGTFPNGCHVCELEVDPETGIVEILRYTVEDDVGVVINPLLLEGQVMGGVAQGLGQAIGEHAVYDPESGQLLTATFMDYTMPRADTMPDMDFHYTEVPSPRNPIGVKGAGEAGTVGAPAAYMNALVNALSERGIDHVDMPATPCKVWELLQSASPSIASGRA